MYKLYVMRHSKSSWSNLNLKDFDRPLNKRGKKNAKLLCAFFIKKKLILIMFYFLHLREQKKPYKYC